LVTKSLIAGVGWPPDSYARDLVFEQGGVYMPESQVCIDNVTKEGVKRLPSAFGFMKIEGKYRILIEGSSQDVDSVLHLTLQELGDD